MANYSPSLLQTPQHFPQYLNCEVIWTSKTLTFHIEFSGTRYTVSAEWEGVQLVAFNLAQRRPREPCFPPMGAQHAATCYEPTGSQKIEKLGKDTLSQSKPGRQPVSL